MQLVGLGFWVVRLLCHRQKGLLALGAVGILGFAAQAAVGFQKHTASSTSRLTRFGS